jgi:hypothetical protein
MTLMASIENLPPDQRAVLDLVLRRGRSYDEIAKQLSIDRAGVRQRALAALDALGPPTRVPAERRALITDYLLGALPASVAAEVREHLSQSASERAWARAVSSELQGIAEHPLPDVPSEAGTPVRSDSEARSPAPAEAASTEGAPATDATAAEAGPAASPARASSRRGGALLLAVASVIVVVVVLLLVLPGGGHKPAPTASRAAAGSTGSTGTTGQTGTTSAAKVVAQINLKPPSGGSSPVGIAEVIAAQGQFGVAIAAQGLSANSKHPANAYAVWLYNSPSDSKILGFVNPAVGKNGQLKTAGGLPTNASHYQKLLVTLETKSNPKTPGTIVLEGALTGL